MGTNGSSFTVKPPVGVMPTRAVGTRDLSEAWPHATSSSTTHDTRHRMRDERSTTRATSHCGGLNRLSGASCRAADRLAGRAAAVGRLHSTQEVRNCGVYLVLCFRLLIDQQGSHHRDARVPVRPARAGLGARCSCCRPRLIMPFVCAHRGASGTHPENTVPAMAEAVRLGCEMVEFDVRSTADGRLVRHHSLPPPHLAPFTLHPD